MSYEFIKVDEDTTKLKYKDKEFTIKKDVNMLIKLQSINKVARSNMIMDLAKKGMTVNNLIVEHKENGKTIQDNSNLDELEKGYIEEAQYEAFNEIVKDTTGMGIAELMLDMGLKNEEAEKFGTDFMMAIAGVGEETKKTPSN